MGDHSKDDVGGVGQWLTPARRTWLYRVITALAPCLVALGVAAQGDVQMWLLLVAAMLGVGGSGVAVANVSIGPRDGGRG
ncbi:hypothetical protein ACFWQG_12995 [Rhodococcus sp. NPDC058532]|uniref:hypothetical protein n=1 Tax=Rhodococcus sp. NPDC058532 TaxID=3346540 RepID=UPI003660166C